MCEWTFLSSRPSSWSPPGQIQQLSLQEPFRSDREPHITYPFFSSAWKSSCPISHHRNEKSGLDQASVKCCQMVPQRSVQECLQRGDRQHPACAPKETKTMSCHMGCPEELGVIPCLRLRHAFTQAQASAE